MKNLIWSFSPWVAFLLGVRVGGVYWGAGIGLAVALVVLVRALSRHSVHMFDVIGVIYFGGLLALLAAISPERHRHLGSLRPGGRPRIPHPDRLRLHPHREALHGALRPGAGARAGLEDRPLP